MATIYKRGQSYYIQWRELGELRRKSLGRVSKDEAETILYAKEVELRTGENILQNAQRITFKAFSREYLDWHKFEYPDSHDRIYQITHSHLIPFFEFHSLAQVDIPSTEKYKRQRAQVAAVGTVNKELRTLQAIINKAVEWGRLPRNPIKSVKPIKDTNSRPARYYTEHELELIYKADPTHADIWRLLANTGMRRAEAFNLKWADVHADSIRMLSTSSQRTKSGKWRDIPLSPGARQALHALENETDHVLPRMNPRSLTRAFDKALKRAGLDGTLHCLRHTFCSHLVMQGVPLRTVQILAGHSSFKTTEGYAHLAPGHLQSSVAGLHL